MPTTRRQLLVAAAALGAATALPVVTLGHARAQSGALPGGAGAPQGPGFHRLTLGDTVVTALLDGTLALKPELLVGTSGEAFADAMQAAYLPTDAYVAPVNAFVVERGGSTILIDAGATSQMAPTLGRLPANLAAAGIAPEWIDRILLTHLHGDHLGALLDGSGAAAFANAEVLVRDRELAFWTDPTEETRIPEAQKMFAEIARAAMGAYQGRVTPFEGDVEVVPGIEAVALYGHTPGHTGYRITDGAGLLVWADVMHVAPLQAANPDVAIAFDISPEDAIASRKRVLEQVAADRTMVTGMHMPFPGFAHIAKDGAAYRIVPAGWQYQL